jgi:tetrapyrrole methylase family protein/MazG family protein
MESLQRLRQIVARLRAPDGCPWDREQTHRSLRAGLLEEAYEVVHAIEEQDPNHLCEELGDLLLHVVFHAQLAQESGQFTFENVAAGIAEKLVRRHPHVFGADHCANSSEVLQRWEDIKRAERDKKRAEDGAEGRDAPESALDGVSGGLPALMRAEKIQKKAARTGFDWAEIGPVLDKVREELAEVEAEIGGNPERLEGEIGDLLFSVVNLARKLKVDGEVALHRGTEKFITRFQSLERLALEKGLVLDKLSPPQMDVLWEEIKTRS